MLAGVLYVVLLMAGAACMAGGFFLGSWHQRAVARGPFDDDEDFSANERVLDIVRTLIHDGLERDERPN
jgi:hypothetical protein